MLSDSKRGRLVWRSLGGVGAVLGVLALIRVVQHNPEWLDLVLLGGVVALCVAVPGWWLLWHDRVRRNRKVPRED